MRGEIRCVQCLRYFVGVINHVVSVKDKQLILLVTFKQNMSALHGYPLVFERSFELASQPEATESEAYSIRPLPRV